ncbi:hypothetical protein ACFQUU_25115 [Herbaspirillum sp. GCM10030257]|uniref:hypothetical protein n=1 Tax=Herbaspirillum sp. GCM10030257 TaxID=3273393 RepID=UPI00360C3824
MAIPIEDGGPMPDYIIESRTPVVAFGQYVVMEGDLTFDPDDGEITVCWVERDGQVVSKFDAIDYANVRAYLLREAEANGEPPPPDFIGRVRIAYQDDKYTMLSARLPSGPIYWLVHGNGDMATGIETRPDALIPWFSAPGSVQQSH